LQLQAPARPETEVARPLQSAPTVHTRLQVGYPPKPLAHPLHVAPAYPGLHTHAQDPDVAVVTELAFPLQLLLTVHWRTQEG
jgi:hypothetical protein